MNLFKNIFVFSLIVSTHPSFGMQQPTPQRQITPSLGGLPPDLKRHLFSYLFNGAPAWAARSISTFAMLNKECNGIANDENRMLACLRMYFHNAAYRAHAVDVGRQLQKTTGALPVMHKNTIKNLLSVMEKQLIKGQQLFSCVLQDNIIELQKLLADEHIDLNGDQPHFGESSLYYALMCGYIDAAQALLAAGANPNGCLGVSTLDLETYRLLLTHGADPDYRLKKHLGITPLIFAASRHSKERVKLLLQAGADPDLKDETGKTARDYARVRLNGTSQCLKIYRVLGRAHYQRKQRLLEQKKQHEST